jgi:hypothetical protein
MMEFHNLTNRICGQRVEKIALWLAARSEQAGRNRLYSQDTTADSATDHDLSYDDALLDSQLRRFYRIEFGQIEPPKGAFLKVLDAIELCLGASSDLKSRCERGLSHTFMSAYSAFMEPYLARLASGGVAVALLFILASAGGVPLIEMGQDATISAGLTRARQLRTNMSERIANQAYVAQAHEVYVYDPAELGRPAIKRDETAGTDRQAPAEYYNRLDSTGAQF